MVKAIRSSQGVLMMSAFLHELLADGGQVEAMFTATSGPPGPTPAPAQPMQSWPPITQTGTRRYEGETFKLDLDYSALTYTWRKFLFGFGGESDNQYNFTDTQTVGNFHSLGRSVDFKQDFGRIPTRRVWG